jgi:uracil-DNA glycosylase
MAESLDVEPLETLLTEIAGCQVCAGSLPLGPRPVLQLSRTARILVASQAPGTKVHHSGVPFADASGDRLREWMGVSAREFYDADKIAIVPMGLCYPGRGAGGDAPPRPECAPLWRSRIMAQLRDLRLTLLVGSHAQVERLGRGAMTERVRGFREHLPDVLPLPHPSWRSQVWMKRNPWFEVEVLPALRAAVREALA